MIPPVVLVRAVLRDLLLVASAAAFVVVLAAPSLPVALFGACVCGAAALFDRVLGEGA